ncbi:hypothetical protein KUTeg_002837 [Tegillarca granosa]|uniref:acylphosphatase n=1 Tax=Tegillarca granosa TaxID=220873 RepID=A0ABQ9FQS7_TEGGR|nr:hypothetical protein KUTeg_002837 [Tegillarca granosa]
MTLIKLTISIWQIDINQSISLYMEKFKVFSSDRFVCDIHNSPLFTFNEAKQNNMVGWVRNTSKGTVEGTVQGKADGINQMVHFLSKVGSPLSTITNAEFKNKRELVSLEYKNFQVKNTDW